MRLLEALAGMSLEAAAPATLTPGAWEAMLPRLNPRTDDRGQVAKDSLPAFLAGYRLPRPLLRALTGSEPLRWRFLAPGARFIDLGVSAPPGDGVGGASDGSIARLLKLSPGLEIPLHDHQGPEYTVIFAGALQEGGAHFARGDVAFRLPGHRHVQHVDRREDCVALQVNEGPLTPLTWKGKLLNLIAGSRS
jgi:putative transcriptional regulator